MELSALGWEYPINHFYLYSKRFPHRQINNIIVKSNPLQYSSILVAWLLSSLHPFSKQNRHLPNLLGLFFPRHGVDNLLTTKQLRSVSIRLFTKKKFDTPKLMNRETFCTTKLPMLEFTKHANFSFHFKGPWHS